MQATVGWLHPLAKKLPIPSCAKTGDEKKGKMNQNHLLYRRK